MQERSRRRRDLRRSARADAPIASDAEPAERHGERRKRNPTSTRLGGARPPVNPPRPSLRPFNQARSGPLRIQSAKRSANKGSETRPEGCRATVVSHFRAGPGALRRAKRGGYEERSREGLEAEPEQPAQLADLHQSSCRRTVAIWRKCDSNLHQTGAGAGAGVSGSCVGVGGAVSDQTRAALAQALELQSMLLELELGGAALLENRAREGETLDP
jgi:hypothetical protein